MHQLFVASPEALKRCSAAFNIEKADLMPFPIDLKSSAKYPFKRMQIGHCFIEAFEQDEVKRIKQGARLRVKASQASKNLEREFVVITHAKDNVFEVARIR